METLYIRVESAPSGKNHAKAIEARAAAKNWAKLLVLAAEVGTPALDQFMVSPKGQWFSAKEGLRTIGRLISRISADKRQYQDARLLLGELASFENILSAAAARGSRFHLSPDQEV